MIGLRKCVGAVAGMACMVSLMAAAASAEQVYVSLRYDVAGLAQMAKEAQSAVANKATTVLQQGISKVMSLNDFNFSHDPDGVYVSLKGQWKQSDNVKDAAEVLRKAALDAAESITTAKMSLAHFKIEVEDAKRRVHPDKDKDKGDDDDEKEARIEQRETARPQPRLHIVVKENLIEDLCILDVPLVRAMDCLGSKMPVAYVLHQEVVGLPVYVRLLGVPLDVALAAIAESVNVKIQKRDKYLYFGPQTDAPQGQAK